MLALADQRPGMVVHQPNAFDPHRGQTVKPVMGRPTVRAWLDGQGITEFPRPTVCRVDGVEIMRADWGRVVIGPGVVCAFIALPAGEEGGGGSKNPLRTVLTVAVLLGGGIAGGALAGAIGGLGGRIAGGLLATAIAGAGGALINALVPPPKVSGLSDYGELPAASPTYSLQAQSNAVRLGQAIPLQYGRMKRYPDLIAQPWQYYAGDEEFLCQPHCLGLGEFDVHAVRIGDTDINAFEEVEYEIVGPGQPAALFDPNVLTRPEVSGQELKGTNEQTGDGYVGPFVGNPVGSVARQVSVDVIAALWGFDENTGDLISKSLSWVIEARELDDLDQPVGGWVTLGSESLSNDTRTPLRRTYTYALNAAWQRYDVRMRRTDEKDTSASVGHEIQWVRLKTFIDGPTSFADVTTLWVRMRATNNLSQASSRLINTDQTRLVAVWDAQTGWSAPVASQSIIWATADAARASYGANLPDERLPLDDWAAQDAEFVERGDTFNGVFDSKVIVWDVLTAIARCGRAVPVQQAGILRIVRHGPAGPLMASFGPRNINRDTFEIEYITPSDETADAVRLEYYSATGWRWREVVGKTADSLQRRVVPVTMVGIDNEPQALREAEYMAHDNRFNRIIVTFGTEMDGLIPTYGDPIAVTMDMPRWGVGGEVVDWDAPSLTLTLSEPVEFTEEATHYIALRGRDGAPVGPYVCTAGAGVGQVVLSAPPAITPYVGLDEQRTCYSFGPGIDKWAQVCRVLAIRPRENGHRVQITAMAEDSRVHVN